MSISIMLYACSAYLTLKYPAKLLSSIFSLHQNRLLLHYNIAISTLFSLRLFSVDSKLGVIAVDGRAGCTYPNVPFVLTSCATLYRHFVVVEPAFDANPFEVKVYSAAHLQHRTETLYALCLSSNVPETTVIRGAYPGSHISTSTLHQFVIVFVATVVSNPCPCDSDHLLYLLCRGLYNFLFFKITFHTTTSSLVIIRWVYQLSVEALPNIPS